MRFPHRPEEKPDRVNMLGWVSGALGRAGIVVLVAVVPFAAWVLWRGPWPEEEGPLWWLPVVVLPLFALLLVERLVYTAGDLDTPVTSRHRQLLVCLSVFAVVLALVVAPVDTIPLIASVNDFAPSESATGLWISALLVALGTVLYLGTLTGSSERPRGRWYAGSFAGGLIVVSAAALVTPLSEYRPIAHSSTAEVSGEPAPVPTDLDEVGWTWSAPEDADVVRVEAGSRGPVVVLKDGLIGLDGGTGEELWSYRARYSYAWSDRERGVFADRNDLASTFVLEGTEEERRRVVLDTATGRIVEEGPFSEDMSLESSRMMAPGPYRGSKAYAHVRGRTLHAFDAQGRILWELPVGEDDPDRFCVANDPSVLAYGELLIFGEMCADNTPEEGESAASTEWQRRVDAAQSSGTVSLTALDVVTGEEVWRREWESHREEYPPALFSVEDPRPVEDPVFLVGDRAFDVRTGEDSDVVPPGLVKTNRFGAPGEDSQVPGRRFYLRADTEGALIAEYPEKESGGPLSLHRTDSDGNVVRTSVLTAPDMSVHVSRGVVLEDALVHTDPGALSTDGQGRSAVVVTPLEEGTVTEEDVRRVDISSDLLSPLEDESETVRADSALVPVPGAVVLVMSVPDGPTELHGLVS